MEARCMGCMHVKTNSPVCEHCGYDERSRNNTHQLPAGTVVGGQYTLGKVLGQGGFGITYIGWDNVMNQRVAVKEYFPSGYAGRDSHSLTVTSYDNASRHDFEHNKLRFLREAEALSKLWNIPQIVKVLRHFEDNGTAYIAMEYIEGQDLRKFMRGLGRPMTVRETLKVLEPVMQALDHVHRADLVHRDISPDNIMLLPDGSAKLLDFGAARYVENADADRDRNTSTQAILKHGFAPPEQYSTHGALGPWTDVYAMCATVYYCLTGKVPPEAMVRSVEGTAMNWDGIPGLTKQQKSALEKGMTLQPGKRFASMEELREKLRPQDSKPVLKKNKKPLLVGAAVVMAVMGISLIINSNKKNNISIAAETTPIPTYTQQVVDPYPEKEHVQPAESVPVETDMTEVPTEANTLPGATDPEQNAPYAMGDFSLVYETNDTGVTITGYEGKLPAKLELPKAINGTPVTEVGYEAFYRCDAITSIVIPESVTSLGAYVFSECTGITSVCIPSSLSTISYRAFYKCTGLESIIICEGVKTIGEEAFYGCTALQNIIIPESTRNIKTSAFEGCINLTNVTIPESVTSIGGLAFWDTPWLAEQKETFVIGGDGILLKYNGAAAHVEIPSNVKKISSAFYNCTALSSIRIPESVTSIGSYAFYKCGGLKSVTIPNGVSSIGDYAFYECTGLKDVIFPEDGTDIGSRAFSGCTGLTSIDIPGNGSSIGSYAFSDCTGLTNVTIQKGLATMSINNPFKGCTNIKNVILPRNSGGWDGVFPVGCSIIHYEE